jgi:iron-sulfur cluster repair protein YtfE (RIC family)
MQMSYQRLIAEHDRVDAALVRLLNHVDAVAPDPVATMLALSRLTDELRGHLAREDAFLYPDLIAGEGRAFPGIAADFVQAFAELRHDWDRYLHEWDSLSIQQDWAGFRHETHSIAARLADRVAAENRLLYAAALREGVIPLRDTPVRGAA